MQSFKNLFVLALGAALAGCGGGGSGAPAPLAVNDVTAPVPVNKLTIHGAVIDDPIDAASVHFRVGDRHFAATRHSDVDGSFSVEIEYDSLDDLVYGEALRDATGIHFVGDVMTVGELLERADNGVVSGARITNLTTAKFVLTRYSTDDGAIDSFDEFMHASRGVDAGALMQMGAAIKAVVEAIDGTVLPADVGSTLELAEQMATGTSSFVNDLNTVSPDTMRASIDKMLTDGYATKDFNLARVPGVYLSTTTLAGYALFADGSGLIDFFDDRDIERVSGWRVNTDGDLVLTYAANDAREDVLQILSDTGAELQINQMRSVASGSGDAYETANFQYLAFEGRFDAATVAGRYTDEQGEVMTLGTDGSGFFSDANGVFQGSLLWNVAGDGRLVITLTSGTKLVMTRLADDGDALRVLTLPTRTGGAVEGLRVQSFVKS